MKRASKKSKSLGISLAEAGLALALALGIMTLMALQSKQSANDLRAQAAAESLKDFHRYALLYLAQNREGVVAASADGTDAASFCVLNADPVTGVGDSGLDLTRKTCAIDVSWLKYKKIVPLHTPELNPYRQKWVAIFRNVFDDYDNNAATPDTSQGDLEVLVIATSTGNEAVLTTEEMLLAASLAGGDAGFVPGSTVGGCGGKDAPQRQACAATGGWRIALDNFFN